MVTIPAGAVELEGHSRIPEGAEKIVVFVHGSGSSRHSSRNNHVAERLEEAGFASLLFDLLTKTEDTSRGNRFDIDLLTDRVTQALAFVADDERTASLELHLFGASTGAAAAIRAAVESEYRIASVVSRGGRPDLAGDALSKLDTPCLLIVGGNDPQVLDLNRSAAEKIPAERELKIVEGATHLFEEPGALDEVADHAIEWIRTH
jgi:putative phosphoribosyl transferase